jgi:hypothetical protein
MHRTVLVMKKAPAREPSVSSTCASSEGAAVRRRHDRSTESDSGDPGTKKPGAVSRPGAELTQLAH